MIGEQIYSLAKKLWKMDRSITGEGVRRTLEYIKNEFLPDLSIQFIPSGTKAFDWIVPPEWKVSEAYIIDPNGNKICDFSVNNLHLVGYSVPFHGKMKLQELEKYLYSIPEKPNAIPYITSYYDKRWGFCIAQEQKDALVQGEYEVVINSKLFKGYLNYGELVLPGESDKEIFISTYICHPSMANNELSGITVATYLAKWLNEISKTHYTYRFVFVPETIGSIVYLSKNYLNLKKKVIAGYNISCVGDERDYSYLPSRNGNTISDKIAKHVLKWIAPDYKSYTWLDRGSDERQYCAPGIDLPIASILRTKYGHYPEYHTSLDNLNEVVTPKGLDGGYWAIRKALEILEKNRNYKTTSLCEFQMSRRGLYPTLSFNELERKRENKIIMDFISYCDGDHSLLDIAEKIDVPAWELYKIIDKLVVNNLIL